METLQYDELMPIVTCPVTIVYCKEVVDYDIHQIGDPLNNGMWKWSQLVATTKH